LKHVVKFYQENFGMKIVNRLDFPEAKFSLYFLAFGPSNSLQQQSSDEKKNWTSRESLLELTHNYGTENDDSYKTANGNSDPGKGFGHICVSVDNLKAACTRLENNNVSFQKKLSLGEKIGSGFAYALDPDGYWIKIIAQQTTPPSEQKIGSKTSSKNEQDVVTNVEKYQFSHTMLRIKDPEKSIPFYVDVLGMKVFCHEKNDEDGVEMFVLGYPRSNDQNYGQHVLNDVTDRDGLLELSWERRLPAQENKKAFN
jgi:lactoylglutathione lyase